MLATNAYFMRIRRFTNGLLGVYLLDSGHDLSAKDNFPWSPRSLPGKPPTLLHAIRYNEKYRPVPSTPNDPEALDGTLFKMHPYHPIAEFTSLSEKQRKLVAHDAFFGLASLLSASANSWNQVVNFIEDDIAAHQDLPFDEIANALAQIRLDSSLIQRFQGIVQSELETLRDGQWREISTLDIESDAGESEPYSEVLEEKKALYRDLVQDYERLVHHLQLLSVHCNSTSSLLQSSINSLEAQKSMEQTTEVNKLTKLAFIFLPVSLIASIFGMNIREISPESTPSAWNFIIVALSVTIPCLYLSLSKVTRSKWFHRR
jgi:Mg2+ and Co2+ transporter CorA